MPADTLLEIWHKARGIIKDAIERKGEPEYPTGFKFIDDATGGFRKGEIWIISAKTGLGKTSLALQLARSFIENPTHNVLFLSLEMRSWELILRMFCSMMNVVYLDLIMGRVAIDEALESTFKKFISRIDFEIMEYGFSFKEVEAIVKEHYQKKPPDVIFLDYLQLISWREFGDQRLALMEYIRRIKEWAKKYNIGFVVVSQLRRPPTGADYNRPPDLADLFGSGSIEQTGDKVLFIYKAIKYNEQPRYYFNLAKNRQGQTVEREVIFEGAYYRFKEWELPEETKKLERTFAAKIVRNNGY